MAHLLSDRPAKFLSRSAAPLWADRALFALCIGFVSLVITGVI